MQEKPGVIFDQLQPVVQGLGYILVDANAATVKGNLQVHCIIYSKDGINTGDCQTVSKAVHPRLEVLYNTQDISLEVSSPGIERKIASLHEFGVFAGKPARVLPAGGEWVNGVIIGVDNSEVIIESKSGERIRIPGNTIQKAQLVYQEVA
jgi:ribosome maturation factor RimP